MYINIHKFVFAKSESTINYIKKCKNVYIHIDRNFYINYLPLLVGICVVTATVVGCLVVFTPACGGLASQLFITKDTSSIAMSLK